MTLDEMTSLLDGVADVIKDYVAKAEAPLLERIKALEAMRPIMGPPGPAGERGERGADGGQGVTGRDGRDAAPAEKGADGLNGKDGADGLNGKDGIDALGFEDVEEFYEDDGRVLVRRWIRGEHVKEVRHLTTQLVYRGVFDGRTYLKGDAVTWGGSMWVAKDTTKAKPGDGATAWTLAVKEGRKGDQGTVGKQGEVGPRGEKGETVAKW